MADYCVRPLTSVESLRRTRKSLGDGTADGRSRIAAPPADRPDRASGTGRRSSSNENATGGAGVPSDPRTITVEARGVTLAPAGDGAVVTWERTTSVPHLVRVPEPSYPSPEVVVPQRGVWQPRIEAEWDIGQFVGNFRGGGEVQFLVNGWVIWPLGEASARPIGGIQARSFYDTLPALELAEGDRVSVRIVRDGEIQSRVLGRCVFTLSQLEPFAGNIEGDGPVPGPAPPTYEETVSALGPSVCADDCETTGPSYWVRFAAAATPGRQILQPNSSPCFTGASGSAPVDPNGPFGDAAFRAESGSPIGSFTRQSGNCGPYSGPTMAAWVRPNGSGGAIVAHRPGIGSSWVESNSFQWTQGSIGNIGFRWYRDTYTVLTGPGWHFVVVTAAGTTSTPGTIRVWVDGTERAPIEIANLDPVDGAGGPFGGQTITFLNGIDAFGTPSAPATGCGLAEYMVWPTILSDPEIAQVNYAALSAAANL